MPWEVSSLPFTLLLPLNQGAQARQLPADGVDGVLHLIGVTGVLSLLLGYVDAVVVHTAYSRSPPHGPVAGTR